MQLYCLLVYASRVRTCADARFERLLQTTPLGVHARPQFGGQLQLGPVESLRHVLLVRPQGSAETIVSFVERKQTKLFPQDL